MNKQEAEVFAEKLCDELGDKWTPFIISSESSTTHYTWSGQATNGRVRVYFVNGEYHAIIGGMLTPYLITNVGKTPKDAVVNLRKQAERKTKIFNVLAETIGATIE